MKNAKRILSILAVIVLVLCSAIPASAEVGDSAVLGARSGVVKVLVYYNNREYPETMGTGFLINEDTIVTAHHVVDDIGSEKVTMVTVVAVGDIEVKADKVTASSARDFAILKLKTKINNKLALPLGVPEGFDATSTVYALGFPEVKEVTNDKITYASTDVTTTSGTVSSISMNNTLKVIQHDAQLDYGNSGGPLMYSDGKLATVVGVNVSTISNGSQYFFSVHIDEVIEALDTLGIPYTPYKAGTPQKTDDSSTTEAASGSETTTKAPETTTESKPGGSGLSVPAIAGIAGGAVLVIILIVVLVVVSKKKNSAPPAPPTGGGFTPPAPPQPQQHTATGAGAAGSEGTTVLSQNMGGDPNATTVLGASASSAYLIRSSNNERINITKPYFKLGKDANRVDYCITGNPAVSRFHASILSKNGQYFIVDNSTTNHTYVNDSMIPANVETQISNGARIKLADEKFEFRI